MWRIPILNRVRAGLSRYIRYRQGKGRLKRLASSRPLRIVIGASGLFETGWIETDIDYLNLLNPRHWETHFRKESIDAILAEHVWEHLTVDEGREAAGRCFEYLRPGGYLRVAVPDGFCPDQGYLERVRPGGTGCGSEDHRVLYNHLTFSEIFLDSGFRVDLLEYYDAVGEFHYKEWDPEGGLIHRSRRFDERNSSGALRYTSIILDAYREI